MTLPADFPNRGDYVALLAEANARLAALETALAAAEKRNRVGEWVPKAELEQAKAALLLACKEIAHSLDQMVPHCPECPVYHGDYEQHCEDQSCEQVLVNWYLKLAATKEPK